MNIFKFGADGTAYARGLNKMRGQTKQFTSQISGMLKGAFAFVGIRGVANVLKDMDRVQKLGQRFEMPAETIQRLGFAAEQSGTSLEVIAKGLAQANRSAIEAGAGLKTYQRAFQDLGINWQDFAKLDQEGQFMALADAVASAADKNRAMAASQVLLGRAGLELLPLLKQGSAGYKKLTGDLSVFSQKQADSAARFNDAVNKMKKTATVFAIDVVDFYNKKLGEWGVVDTSTKKEIYDPTQEPQIESLKNTAATMARLEEKGIEIPATAKIQLENISDKRTPYYEDLLKGAILPKIGISFDEWMKAAKPDPRPDDATIEAAQQAAVAASETVSGKKAEQAQVLQNAIEAAQEAAIAVSETVQNFKELGGEIPTADTLTTDQEIATQQDTTAPSIITSALQSIGGGGGVAVFGNDPLLNENKRQTVVLEAIRDGLYGFNPITGETTSRPEL